MKHLFFKRVAVIGLLVVLPLLLAGNATAQSSEQNIGGSYSLTDHHGQPVSDKSFLGAFQIVTFGYTFCPDVCPVTLTTLSQIIDLLEARDIHLQAIFITLDPERDTVDQLAGYVGHFHPKIVGLTGSLAQIQQVADAYRVVHRRIAGDDEATYHIEHSAVHYLMDAEGQYAGHLDYDVSPETAAGEIAALIRAHQS
ncbi:MAG: SCO family protein [Rhodospirillales bacterium]|nr:SCO family protein [Rhodospirillales bacterium]